MHAPWTRAHTTAEARKAIRKNTKHSPATTKIKSPRKRVPHGFKGLGTGSLNREGGVVDPSPKQQLSSVHTPLVSTLGILQPLGILSPLHHIRGDKEPWPTSLSWLLFHKSARLINADNLKCDRSQQNLQPKWNQSLNQCLSVNRCQWQMYLLYNI